MNFLSSKNEPGFFNYKESSNRMKLFVKWGCFPTLDEFWIHETDIISVNPRYNIHRRKGAKEEFRRRLYSPSMQEALLQRAIRIFGKSFVLLEVTDDEDRNGKIDLKVRDLITKDEIIIQVKSSIPNFQNSKFIQKELWPQMNYFNRTAEYVVPIFHEDFLPYCEFQYVKSNGEISIYKPHDSDIMLLNMLHEQQRKSMEVKS